jgi:hypothetical protein
VGVIPSPHDVSPAKQGYSRSISRPSNDPGNLFKKSTQDDTNFYLSAAVEMKLWKALE